MRFRFNLTKMSNVILLFLLRVDLFSEEKRNDIHLVEAFVAITTTKKKQ